MDGDSAGSTRSYPRCLGGLGPRCWWSSRSARMRASVSSVRRSNDQGRSRARHDRPLRLVRGQAERQPPSVKCGELAKLRAEAESDSPAARQVRKTELSVAIRAVLARQTLASTRPLRFGHSRAEVPLGHERANFASWLSCKRQQQLGWQLGGDRPPALVSKWWRTSVELGVETRFLVAVRRDSAELRAEPGRIQQPMVAARATSKWIEETNHGCKG